jgi:tetratricopeptide (TPR) repeat protein
MARVRIDQLPATREALLDQRRVRPIRLPALRDPLDDAEPRPPSAEERAEARGAMERCLEQLSSSPNDAGARERLANALEQLGRLDEAVAQWQTLLQLPNPPPGRPAEWLSRLAAVHLHCRHDPGAARPILERLVREYPQSAQALTAHRRLRHLEH